jgi:hypothetical protein
MTELIGEALPAVLLFIIVFVLNLLPAFAPPTWVTLSFIGLTLPDAPVVVLALIGAIAATLGRMTLAKLSRVVVRASLLGDRERRNIDAIRDGFERHRTFTLSMFLAYAFSPLPSNYLFIAYGLTTLRLRFLAVPFFIGRLISYSFWVGTASAVGGRLDLDSLESASYAGIYFILSQLLIVPVIYAFTRLDWRAMIERRTLRWLKSDHAGGASSAPATRHDA